MNTTAVNNAIRTMAIRAEKLSPRKQAELRYTLENNQGIDPETINLLILMHEHSDDDGNITNQTLRNIMDNASATDQMREGTNQ